MGINLVEPIKIRLLLERWRIIADHYNVSPLPVRARWQILPHSVFARTERRGALTDVATLELAWGGEYNNGEHSHGEEVN